MAIFTGTWKDVDGVPFTPEGKIFHATAGGGQVGMSRAGFSNHPQHSKLVKTIGYIRHRWFHILTQPQRDVWDWIAGALGIHKRGDMTYRYTNGFLAFVAAVYVEVWWSGSTNVVSPMGGVVTIHNIWVAAVSWANQTIKFGFSYDQNYAQSTNPVIACYQMKPIKSKVPTCWRDTRLLGLHSPQDVSGGTDYFTFNAKWKLEYQRTVRTYIRVRINNGWGGWWTSSHSIPY